MISPIIHSFWFGKNMKSDLLKRCEESWYKICPDYEIKIWTEDNWDVGKYKYSQQAYDAKRFAFVCDCCRVDVLYKYGGVSVDGDVEFIKPFTSEILSQRAFTCKESSGRWISAVFGSEANHPWIRKILKYYRNNDFEYNPSKITNTVLIDNINKKLYKETINDIIYLYGDVAIYPRDYFEAKNWSTGKIEMTDNTFCVHHYQASWLDK